MSSDAVIQVDALSKRYRLGVVGTGTLSHDLNRWWAQIRGKPDPYLRIGQKTKSRNKTKDKNKFQLSALNPLSALDPDDPNFVWALRDVSFEVKRGEVLGIIGRNGAGKSTLLKILSRVTAPTTGQIRVKGRIASLLEVGTGFHPELTGSENILLNGAILGMTKQEIKNKFAEIVDFAGVEKFIDTPVKRYSSGMYVRLAFAVAAHLDPEILIVDEVLAVGDAEFQKKCLGKMQDVAGQGRTVLFVSHNMAMINNLCGSTVFLKNGQLNDMGTTERIVASYLRATASPMQSTKKTLANLQYPDIHIISFAMEDVAGAERICFKTTESIRLVIIYQLSEEIRGLRIGYDVQSAKDGQVLFRTFDDDEGAIARLPGRYQASCVVPGNLFVPGEHAVRLQIGVHQGRWIIHDLAICQFTVCHLDGTNSRLGDQRPGIIMPKMAWSTTLVNVSA